MGIQVNLNTAIVRASVRRERLDDAVVVGLFTALLEPLANAAKHARAAHVRLQIAGANGDVRLTVADDGVGIDASAESAPGHFGLLTARQRVAAAGGRLTIETAPGEGSRVAVVVPDA